MPRRDRLEFTIEAKDETTSGVRSAMKSFEGLESTATSSFGGIDAGAFTSSSGITGIGSAALGAAGVVGGAMGAATLAIGGVTAAAKLAVAGIKTLKEELLATAEASREIGFLAKQAGIGVEQLSIYELAGERVGLAFGETALAIREVSARIGEVDVAIRQGGGIGGEPGEAIAELGLDIQDLLKLDPEGQFRAVGEALLGVRNESTRAALANSILSDQYAEMLPQLLRVVEGFDGIAQEAVESGLVTTAAQAEASTRLLETWTAFNQEWRAGWKGVLDDNATELTEFITKAQGAGPVTVFLGVTDGFSEVFGSFLSTSNSIIDRIGDNGIADTLTWSLNKLNEVGIFGLIFPEDGTGAFDNMSESITTASTGFTSLLSAAQATFPTISELIDTWGTDSESDLGGVDTSMEALEARIGNIFGTGEATGYWGAGLNLAQNQMETWANFTLSTFGNVSTGIAGVFNIMNGLIIGDWDRLWLGVLQITQAGANQMLTGLELVYDSAVDLGAGAIEGLSSFYNAIRNFTVEFTAPVITKGEGLWSVPTISFEKQTWQPFGGATPRTIGSGIGAAGAAGDTGLADVFGNVFDQAAGRLLQRKSGRQFDLFTFADDFAESFAQAEKDAFFGTSESDLSQNVTDLVTRARASSYDAQSDASRNIPAHILQLLSNRRGQDAIYNQPLTTDRDVILAGGGLVPNRPEGGGAYEPRIVYNDHRTINNNATTVSDRQFEDQVAQATSTLISRGALLPIGVIGGN